MRVGFDYSGTLVDDRSAVHKANIALALKIGGKKAGKGIGDYKLDDLHVWLSGTKGSVAEWIRSLPFLRDVLRDGKWSDEKLQEEYVRLYKIYEELVKPYEGVGWMLSQASKIAELYVISTHPQDVLENELKEFGLRDFFSGVFGDAHLRGGKRKLIEELGLDVYVGDTRGDIIAAAKAKVIPVHVTWGYHPPTKIEPIALEIQQLSLSEKREKMLYIVTNMKALSSLLNWINETLKIKKG